MIVSPKPQPRRKTATYSSARPGWEEMALQLLLDGETIIVDGVLLDGATFHPRRPAWGQMCRRLNDAGILGPAISPGSDRPAIHVGPTGPAG